MGDVGDVNLWWDGGMERSHAQILPPLGVGKVRDEGKKRMVRWCLCSKILKAHHIAMGVVCTRSVVEYTWTWASLGFPTGLVRI